jgi:hypothetical protein
MDNQGLPSGKNFEVGVYNQKNFQLIIQGISKEKEVTAHLSVPLNAHDN